MSLPGLTPGHRPAGRAGGRRDEQGSALPFLVACLGLLLMVGAALGVVSAMFVAHRTAQAAADLSALAGARTQADTGDGCVAADAIAAGNGSRLLSCVVDGRDVVVRVEVTGPRWLGARGDLQAEARAGPTAAAASPDRR